MIQLEIQLSQFEVESLQTLSIIIQYQKRRQIFITQIKLITWFTANKSIGFHIVEVRSQNLQSVTHQILACLVHLLACTDIQSRVTWFFKHDVSLSSKLTAIQQIIIKLWVHN